MPKVKYIDEDRESIVTGGEEFVRIYERDRTLPMKFGCRKGNCGVCAIYVRNGMENLSRSTVKERETLQRKKLDEKSHRLACQCAINGDVEVKWQQDGQDGKKFPLSGPKDPGTQEGQDLHDGRDSRTQRQGPMS